MSNETDKLLEAPEPCDEIMEDDSRIEEIIDIEPEEDLEDFEDTFEATNNPKENFEHQFSRYERNYRARRIRELALAPLPKRKRGRPSSNDKAVA